MKNLLTQLAEIDTGNIPCSDGGCSDANIVARLVTWSFIVIAIMAVIIIVIAGIQFLTSQGEPDKVKRAQNTITYAVIGLLVSGSAGAIVGFVTGAFR